MPYHRSEEHTSELQSHDNLVCRLLLEKKKDRKSTRLNSSHTIISYAVFCFKKERRVQRVEAGREQDDRGKGDHYLADDHAHVPQHVEDLSYPVFFLLQPGRPHRPPLPPEDRVRD